jgi:hypothetical protein
VHWPDIANRNLGSDNTDFEMAEDIRLRDLFKHLKGLGFTKAFESIEVVVRHQRNLKPNCVSLAGKALPIVPNAVPAPEY